MIRFRRIAASFGLLLMAQFTLADAANAVNLSWTNALGGPAGVPGNWSPAQVPTALDNLSFNLNNTFVVTFGAAVPASDYLAVENGKVTLRFPTAHTVSTFLGTGGPGKAELTIESGSLTALRNLYTGHVVGDTGTVSVTGPTTTVNCTDPTAVTSIGDQGVGTLNVLDGGTLTVAKAPEVGIRSGGRGTLVVAGVSATSPFPRARLIVNNSSTDAVEIGPNGTGAAGVLFGAQMDVAGSVELGSGSVGGVGSLVVAGTGGSDSARVNIGGDLMIARNATSGVVSSTGIVSVTGGGVVDVAGSTYTFDPDGSDGELEIRENARFETRSLFVDDPATELDFTGGQLQVRGGTLDLGAEPLVLNSSTGTPTLELHDNAQAPLGSTTSPAITVGDNAAGALKVLYGSILRVFTSNVIVGNNAGGLGVLDVSHTGTAVIVDQTLLVGRAGNGTLNANQGSTTTVFSLGVATQPGGVGNANIDGTGTNVHVTDMLEVAGLSSGASNADGNVRVSDNASLWLDRPLISGDVWPTGEIAVEAGGNLRLTGTLLNRGIVDLNLGNTIGGVIQPIAGGSITGAGSASSSIFAVLDTTGRITNDGPLHLGLDSSPLGFQFLGTLEVPVGEVTLHDADSAVVGTVLMTGGTLHGPAGGIHVPLDRRVSGSGTISGPIRPVGRILATNSNGITFLGPVLGVGQGMNGSLLRFGAGGSFIGFGRLDASVRVDSGGVILPTLDLTLGRAPLNSSVTIDGTLAIGPSIEVDLNGTDTTRVSGLLAMAQGFLQNAATSPLLLKPAGRLVGNGTVRVATVNDGTIDPAPGTNDLRFGALTQRSGGILRFDVGSYPTGQLDTVNVDGTARLNGTLELHSLPGYVPVVGDSFKLMTYGSRAGTFATVTIDGLSATGILQVVYRATEAWVRIIGTTVGVQDPIAAAPHAVQFSSMGSPARALVFALVLPEAANVTVELFDLNGRRVSTLHDGELAAGRHRLERGPTAPLAGGLYFARATVRGSQTTIVRTARATQLR